VEVAAEVTISAVEVVEEKSFMCNQQIFLQQRILCSLAEQVRALQPPPHREQRALEVIFILIMQLLIFIRGMEEEVLDMELVQQVLLELMQQVRLLLSTQEQEMVEEAVQLVLLVESATILQIELNPLQAEKHGHFLEIGKVEQGLLEDLIELLVAVVLVQLVQVVTVHHMEVQEFKLILMEITGTGVAVAVVLVVLQAMGQVVMVASVVVEAVDHNPVQVVLVEEPQKMLVQHHLVMQQVESQELTQEVAAVVDHMVISMEEMVQLE
jgi:hypothetical protein